MVLRLTLNNYKTSSESQTGKSQQVMEWNWKEIEFFSTRVCVLHWICVCLQYWTTTEIVCVKSNVQYSTESGLEIQLGINYFLLQTGSPGQFAKHCCICEEGATPLPPTPPPPPPPPSGCFPSLAEVILENGKSVTMSKLKIGDRVQTGGNTKLKYFTLFISFLFIL